MLGTGDISLNDIREELCLNKEHGLDNCFSVANTLHCNFNATYEGSKDRLSNFKGMYLDGLSSITALYLANGSSLCSDTGSPISIQYSHSNLATCYSVGGIIYTSHVNRTRPSSGWYSSDRGGTWYQWDATQDKFTATFTCP